MQGKIKWFNDKKGYGYIEYHANGKVTMCFYNSDGSKEIELVSDGSKSSLKEKEKTN